MCRAVLLRSLCLVLPLTLAGAAAARADVPSPQARAAYLARVAPKPYMGWSSWSLQSTKFPGVNPYGDYSWLTEDHVLEQAGAMAAKLRAHGYEYVNIDAGWWRKWDWTPEYDRWGRPAVDATRFPHGIAYVADRVHRLGLKLGIYMPVGLEKGGYDQDPDATVNGAPWCTMRDVVYPDLRTTNGWDSSYKIDFDNGTGCGQAYIDSIAREFAGWGVDFLKLDGVGPGSWRSGPNYDNRADVRAWSNALYATHRPIQLVLSWSLDHDYVGDWKAYSNGWRIDGDVECYCGTLVEWDHSVKQRWDDVVDWIDDSGRGGWNNLDSLDVGVGSMDGLTDAERQSYMTLWAIEGAPLYSGDDLTKLDDYGLSLLTNDEVIAIDQAGRPARPVTPHVPQQVWYARNPDGSYVVALFNLDAAPATVSARWSDLGLSGAAAVRDVWSHTNLGRFDGGFSAPLGPHASRLLKVVPRT